MTTITAAQRRAELANAHARWMTTIGKEPLNDFQIPAHEAEVIIFEDALVAAGAIADGSLLEITMTGTTICIQTDDGERLELDAYGNIIRGEA